MQAAQPMHRRSTTPRWRGLTLVAISFALVVALVAFAPLLDLPLIARIVLSALAGLGMMAGLLMRAAHSK